jgi:ABC transporter substrate binding protein (PQQ-dependent alcohol dehydrogenase system)
MIERLDGFLAAALLGLALTASTAAAKAEPPARAMTVGYVELASDPRYANRGSIAGIAYPDLGRAYPGAELALQDAKAIGRVIHVDFSLEKTTGNSVAALAGQVAKWLAGANVHFVLADLPSAALNELAHRFAAQPVMLLNVSSPDDALRGKDCMPNVLHLYPSNAMLADALLQFLIAKDWRHILVLQGPTAADAGTVTALRRSVQKFQASIVGVRPFLLTNDPRNRDESNIALMTAGAHYDVVYVADSSGELGRYVPYQTSLPRPVVGSAGLMPTAWSWNWNRDAAVQLQHRFERLDPRHRMNGADWAAWAAVKAITEAVMHTNSTGFAPVKSYLLSDKLNLDTVKGNPGSFRPWDHQLRAPVLLATADAVIDRAPLPEFLHQTNVLDTLGIDAPETQCRF